jgi:hypothetical protein
VAVIVIDAIGGEVDVATTAVVVIVTLSRHAVSDGSGG